MFVWIGVSLVAYLEEGWRPGLTMLPILLPMTALWAYLTCKWSYSVQLKPDGMTIWRLGRPAFLPYDAITAVRLTHRRLIIGSPQATFRLHFHTPAIHGQLYLALKERVPAVGAAETRRLQTPLPFVVSGMRVMPTIMFLIGLTLLILVVSVTRHIIAGAGEQAWSGRLFALLFSLAAGVSGLFFCYHFLFVFVWRYVFTKEAIVVRHVLRRRSFDAGSIRNLSLGERQARVKGVWHTLHFIRVEFADKHELRIEPNAASFPFEYAGLNDAIKLKEILALLSLHYLPPAKVEAAAPAELPTPELEQETCQPVRILVEEIRQLGDGAAADFENLRDRFNALGPPAMASILRTALEVESGLLFELLVTVLADNAYPSAMPHFVRWLDHASEEVRFVAAMALDSLAGGRFGVENMIHRGRVQGDRIQAVVPDIRAWWQASGKDRVPSEAEWRQKTLAQSESTAVSERESWYNFIELNRRWVRLGNGTVFEPETSYRLPRNQGLHIVGGQVHLPAREGVLEAAIEMDSETGTIVGAYVREDGRWLNVLARAQAIDPYYRFETPNVFPDVIDVRKTRHLWELCQVAYGRRDEDWQASFLADVITANMTTGEQPVSSGPDGFPYFHMRVLPHEVQFRRFSLLSLLEDLCRQGLGVVVTCDRSAKPCWVFSFGDIWNFRETQAFYATPPRYAGNSLQIDERRIMIAQPSYDFLPLYVRRILHERLVEDYGVANPCLFMIDDFSLNPFRSLIFNVHRQDFASDHDFTAVMQFLRWSLPRDYGLLSLVKDSEFDSYFSPVWTPEMVTPAPGPEQNRR